MGQDDWHAGRLRHLTDLLGFLIHRTLRSFHDKVASHVWTLYPRRLAGGDRSTVHAATPPLFTPRYNIASSWTRRDGRGSGNYAISTLVPTPNRIGPTDEASSI
jgi:hypothetical protein